MAGPSGPSGEVDLVRVQRECRALLAKLVAAGIPRPFDAAATAAVLAARRGRRLRIASYAGEGGPSGAWVSTDDEDFVVHAEALTGVHRDVVLAHELAHVAFDHAGLDLLAPEEIEQWATRLSKVAVRRMVQRRGSYSEVEEAQAEVLATLLVQGEEPLADGGLGQQGDEQLQRLASAFTPTSRPRRWWGRSRGLGGAR